MNTVMMRSIVISLFCSSIIYLNINAQPTAGWTQVPYTYKIQKPYDLSVSDRYSFVDSVHDFWVYATDKPHLESSKTKPRSEIQIIGNDYTTSGQHQFEADFFIPSGVSDSNTSGNTGTSIMQIFGGGGGHATSFMLRVYNGVLKRYNEESIMTDIYDRWYHLNVTHNAETGEIKVYIDGILKLISKDYGNETHYFKCGVYNQAGASFRNEAKFKNIKIWELATPNCENNSRDKIPASPE
jgi:hypothetical protein